MNYGISGAFRPIKKAKRVTAKERKNQPWEVKAFNEAKLHPRLDHEDREYLAAAEMCMQRAKKSIKRLKETCLVDSVNRKRLEEEVKIAEIAMQEKRKFKRGQRFRPKGGKYGNFEFTDANKTICVIRKLHVGWVESQPDIGGPYFYKPAKRYLNYTVEFDIEKGPVNIGGGRHILNEADVELI
jgi:hypothetical protein